MLLREDWKSFNHDGHGARKLDEPLAGFVLVNNRRPSYGTSRPPYPQTVCEVWEPVTKERYSKSPQKWLSLPESRFLFADTFDDAEVLLRQRDRELPAGLSRLQLLYHSKYCKDDYSYNYAIGISRMPRIVPDLPRDEVYELIKKGPVLCRRGIRDGEVPRLFPECYWDQNLSLGVFRYEHEGRKVIPEHVWNTLPPGWKKSLQVAHVQGCDSLVFDAATYDSWGAANFFTYYFDPKGARAEIRRQIRKTEQSKLRTAAKYGDTTAAEPLDTELVKAACYKLSQECNQACRGFEFKQLHGDRLVDVLAALRRLVRVHRVCYGPRGYRQNEGFQRLLRAWKRSGKETRPRWLSIAKRMKIRAWSQDHTDEVTETLDWLDYECRRRPVPGKPKDLELFTDEVLPIPDRYKQKKADVPETSEDEKQPEEAELTSA